MTRGDSTNSDVVRMTRGRSETPWEKKWNNDRPRQAFELALLGLTDDEMAPIMDVSTQTIEYWKRTKPEFRERSDAGKVIADSKVAVSMYQSAIGYSHPDCQIFLNTVEILDEEGKVVERRKEPLIVDTIKYYPPNVFIGHKWLTIRQREKWADIHRAEITNNLNITDNRTYQDLDDDELLLAEKLGVNKLLDGINGNAN